MSRKVYMQRIGAIIAALLTGIIFDVMLVHRGINVGLAFFIAYLVTVVVWAALYQE